MRNLAIIPARGGSKRLPRKNIKKLNGKPLIHYTLEAVIESSLFETVVLSSDDDEILEIGQKIEGVTSVKRDSKLAGDTTKVIDLVKQITEQLNYNERYDCVGLFLPTCPFRTAQHIKEGFSLLTKEDFSVVSVTEMQDPVQLSLTLNQDNIANLEALLSPSPLVTGQTRSQDFNAYYRVNGGFYIAWVDKFIKNDNFFQGQVKGYPMSRLQSVDIDDYIDFEWAEYLLKKEYIQLK